MSQETKLAKGPRSFNVAPVAAGGRPELRERILAGYSDTLCYHEMLAMARSRTSSHSACANGSNLPLCSGRNNNTGSTPTPQLQSIPGLGKNASAI